MYRGRVRFEPPVLWAMGFLVTFTIGGMTGVLTAVPGADFVLHNSLFLVAHFHNVIIGGVVFGVMAGLNYWFPKAFGFKLDERLGKISFWCWLIGYYLAFTPLYILGLMGATRRVNHFDNPNYQPYLIVAMIGALVIGAGILATLVQVAYSVAKRKSLVDVTGDPWDARTLEWATSSPPPFYNFARTPHVHGRDAFWEDKQEGLPTAPEPVYAEIHMPRNTGTGVVLSAIAVVLGFALIWHIWWLAIGGLAAAIVVAIGHSFNENRDYYVQPDVVARTEGAYFQKLGSQEA
jgi:cytochrome o ubiquinol oxidase subunit 1